MVVEDAVEYSPSAFESQLGKGTAKGNAHAMKKAGKRKKVAARTPNRKRDSTPSKRRETPERRTDTVEKNKTPNRGRDKTSGGKLPPKQTGVSRRARGQTPVKLRDTKVPSPRSSSTAKKTRNKTPQRPRDSTPKPKTKNATPTRDSTPKPKTKNATPTRVRDKTPNRSRNATPTRKKNATPKKTRDNTPNRGRNITPGKRNHGSPRKMKTKSSRDETPQRGRGVPPTGNKTDRNRVPQKMKTRQSSPTGQNRDRSRNQRSTPQTDRDATPGRRRNPQGTDNNNIGVNHVRQPKVNKPAVGLPPRLVQSTDGEKSVMIDDDMSYVPANEINQRGAINIPDTSDYETIFNDEGTVATKGEGNRAVDEQRAQTASSLKPNEDVVYKIGYYVEKGIYKLSNGLDGQCGGQQGKSTLSSRFTCQENNLSGYGSTSQDGISRGNGGNKQQARSKNSHTFDEIHMFSSND